MMTVPILMFVTREAVSMHVDYPIVDSTQNVKLVAIRQDVYVYQGTQETLALHVPYVSTQKIFILFYIFFFSFCTLYMHDFVF